MEARQLGAWFSMRVFLWEFPEAVKSRTLLHIHCCLSCSELLA